MSLKSKKIFMSFQLIPKNFSQCLKKLFSLSSNKAFYTFYNVIWETEKEGKVLSERDSREHRQCQQVNEQQTKDHCVLWTDVILLFFKSISSCSLYHRCMHTIKSKHCIIFQSVRRDANYSCDIIVVFSWWWKIERGFLLAAVIEESLINVRKWC